DGNAVCGLVIFLLRRRGLGFLHSLNRLGIVLFSLLSVLFHLSLGILLLLLAGLPIALVRLKGRLALRLGLLQSPLVTRPLGYMRCLLRLRCFSHNDLLC